MGNTVGEDNARRYFFVLQFDPNAPMRRVIELRRQGVLKGKRLGRPRYKAMLNEPIRTLSVDNCTIVPAYMVTKTPSIQAETWDILE